MTHLKTVTCIITELVPDFKFYSVFNCVSNKNLESYMKTLMNESIEQSMIKFQKWSLAASQWCKAVNNMSKKKKKFIKKIKAILRLL